MRRPRVRLSEGDLRPFRMPPNCIPSPHSLRYNPAVDPSQTQMLRRAPRWVAPFAVGLLAAAAYVNTLGNGFVCDDLVQVVQNPELTSLSNVPKFFTEPYWRNPGAKDRLYRPVTVTTLAIDRVIGGGEEARPAQFHATNLFLHVCVSLLVFGVCAAWYRIVHARESVLAAEADAREAAAIEAREKEVRESGHASSPKRPRPGATRITPRTLKAVADIPSEEPSGAAPGGTTTRYWPISPTAHGLWSVPVVAAMLFAVHPVHTDAVDSIVQRSEILATGAVLVGLWAGWQADATRGQRRITLLVLAGLAYLFGLGSKETAVVLPLLWLVHDAFFESPSREAPSRLAKYVVAGVALAAYVAARFAALGWGVDTRAAFGNADLLARLATMTTVFGDYVRLLVWPHPLCADYAANANPGVFCATFGDNRAGAAVLLLGIAVALGVWAWRRRTPIGVWLPWVPVGLIPVANVIPIGAIEAERFCYLPSVGVCVALATLFVPIRPQGFWNGFRRFAGVLAICAGLALTRERNPVWATPLSFANALIVDAPENPFGHYMRGVWNTECHAHEAALHDYSEAIRIVPGYLNARYRRALTLDGLRRHSEAAADFEFLITVQPENWDARNNLALMCVRDGEAVLRGVNAGTGDPLDKAAAAEYAEERFERAIREYTHVLEVDQQRVPAVWNNRAKAFLLLRRYADAVADLREYLDQVPRDWATWAYLAAWEATLGHEEEVRRIVKLLEESGHFPSDAIRADYEARLKAFREHGGSGGR